LWLFWRQKDAFLLATPPALGWGVSFLVFGLLLYVVGRSQDITIFEAGALAPILAGALLAMRGWAGLRAFWFPILFVAFLVPLPGIFVDALTGPLKAQVSQIAEELLYVAGYPVARNGVMLTVGQYQLLVADACSGLNSMFSLSALGLLYLYIMQRRSWLHNGLMIASILPIAFVANIVRVLALVLVTYHFGDEAGQGFLHGAAGIVLLLVALTFILALDAVLARIIRPRKAA
jgi:exosortase B